MGVSGNEKIRESEKLKILLKKHEVKFENILKYYININRFQDNISFFEPNYIIILLTIKEIEIFNSYISTKTKYIKIPQFILESKKAYNMRFKCLINNDNYILNCKEKINSIKKNLEKFLNNTKNNAPNLSASSDNFCCSIENMNIFSIIEDAFKYKADEYIYKIIYKEISSKEKEYTTEYLNKLYIIKYFTQLMIFIQEVINYTINLENIFNRNNNLLNYEEMKLCKRHCFDEDKIMTLSLFKELNNCNYKVIKNKPDLIKNNEKKLDDLIKVYIHILKKINKIEVNLKDNNKEIF